MPLPPPPLRRVTRRQVSLDGVGGGNDSGVLRGVQRDPGVESGGKDPHGSRDTVWGPLLRPRVGDPRAHLRAPGPGRGQPRLCLAHPLTFPGRAWRSLGGWGATGGGVVRCRRTGGASASTSGPSSSRTPSSWTGPSTPLRPPRRAGPSADWAQTGAGSDLDGRLEDAVFLDLSRAGVDDRGLWRDAGLLPRLLDVAAPRDDHDLVPRRGDDRDGGVPGGPRPGGWGRALRRAARGAFPPGPGRSRAGSLRFLYCPRSETRVLPSLLLGGFLSLPLLGLCRRQPTSPG